MAPALTTILDRPAVEALSRSDPAWLRELRLNALARFDELPLPTERTEGWRRLALSGIDLTPPAPEPWVSSTHIGSSDQRSGAAAMPIGEAIAKHEAAARQALGKPAGTGSLAKFTALNDAAWSGGAFIYIPDGVTLAEPIQLEATAAAYPRVIVWVGAGARAAVVETHKESSRLTCGVTDVIVGEGARLAYAHAQLCGPETVTFSRQRAQLARDARLVTLNFGMGGKLSKCDVEVDLLGAGAESDMLGLVFAERAQQFDYHTLQGHRAPNTRSDLLYKNALDEDSRSIYTGVIIIDRGAQRSDAYQANRNLLLSAGARADTEPKLEIQADDVRCTHGATVGPIDDEQLFYLGSRGLDPEDGARLIVEGFFEEVFEKVGDRAVVAPLQKLVAPHIGRLGAQ